MQKNINIYCHSRFEVYTAEQSMDNKQQTNDETYIPATNHPIAPAKTPEENCGNSEKNNAKTSHDSG